MPLFKLKKFIQAFMADEHSKLSYSQCGEDLIIDFLISQLKISNFKYLDIGAHHPTYISNTFLFYEKGYSGVCIEPDPFLFKTIAKRRSKDKCLNIGVGLNNISSAPFYIMTEKTLNTFSKEEADKYASYGKQKIEQIIDLPLIRINDIIKNYLHPFLILYHLMLKVWILLY